MSTLQVNTINESTSGSGVTIDGVKLKDNIVETDTINEKTSAAGVTIDGLKIKDVSASSEMSKPILQYVVATNSTTQSTTSTSYADITNLTADITPSSTSSKVLIIFSDNFWINRAQTSLGGHYIINKGGSDIDATHQELHLIVDGNTSNKSLYATHHFEYIDSPSTTSSTTYKVRFKANTGTTFYSQNGNKTASLILMELAG